jgi:aspartate/methionine/tyrosine aminotransferase
VRRSSISPARIPRRCPSRAPPSPTRWPRGYAPDPRGELAAREAIAAYHRAGGAEIEADQIVLTAGTSEGYAQLFRVLADPGDVVHLPTPGYPLFEHLAELEGLASERYALEPPRAPNGAQWTLAQGPLRASLTARSRALLLIHPHNPTGAFVSPADLAAVRALARERELALLCDEVFLDSASGACQPSALVEAGGGPLTCVLSGASKVLGVPQLKVAWIAVAGAQALRDEALARLEFAADAYLAVSPIAARALPALFARRSEIRAALCARVAANRAALAAALRDVPGVCVLPAQAGWASILRIADPDPEPDEEALALALLAQRGVLIHPGFLFELAPEVGAAQLVANLMAAPEEFSGGARELAHFLAGRARA